MNRKIIALAVFLAAFTASLWLFLPYKPFIDNIISATEKNTGMSWEYDSSDDGIFYTRYYDVKINGRETGDVSFSHNPLMLLRKKIRVTSTGIYNTDAVMSEDSVRFTLETAGQAMDYISKPVRFEGRVYLEGFLTATEAPSELRAQIAKAIMTTPIGELAFENVTASVEIKGNMINVLSLKATGKTELNMSGTVHLDKRHPAMSDVQLTGTAGVLGIRKNMTLKGTVGNLHPIFN